MKKLIQFITVVCLLVSSVSVSAWADDVETTCPTDLYHAVVGTGTRNVIVTGWRSRPIEEILWNLTIYSGRETEQTELEELLFATRESLSGLHAIAFATQERIAFQVARERICSAFGLPGTCALSYVARAEYLMADWTDPASPLPQRPPSGGMMSHGIVVPTESLSVIPLAERIRCEIPLMDRPEMMIGSVGYFSMEVQVLAARFRERQVVLPVPPVPETSPSMAPDSPRHHHHHG